jgi:DNA-binding NarL/FixJ family response regulator
MIMQTTHMYPSETAIAPVKLSPRELEILRLVAEGQSNPEIAATLYLSLGTVKTHVRNILSKFGVGHRLQAAVFALRQGLI